MRYPDPHDLAALWHETRLDKVETAPLEVEAEYGDFDDFWEPFLSGAAPGGAYCASLSPERQVALREECRRRLDDPRGPFTLTARAWAVRGRV
jgi:hypothetical protein